MKRLRASTFEDLREFRAAVSTALEKSGFDVARMEGYPAADMRPLDMCLRDVDRCQAFVGLYGWRYGYIPPPEQGNPEQRSITELEYRHVAEKRLPTWLFLAHEETRCRPVRR